MPLLGEGISKAKTTQLISEVPMSEEAETQRLTVIRSNTPPGVEHQDTTIMQPVPGKNGTKTHSAFVASKGIATPPAPAPVVTPAVHKKLIGKKLQMEQKKVLALYNRCRQLGNMLFWQKQTITHSLGFTSAIKGEGKSFLAAMMAYALSEDSTSSVFLVECTWEQPQFQQIFNCAPVPGLAELLRGECSPEQAFRRVQHNMIVVPAGNGGRDAVKLLQLIRQRGVHNLFGPQYMDDLFVLDLPAVLTSPYGLLAAEAAEELCLVVRAGVTSEAMVSEMYTQLKHLSLQGVILNEVESKIPRWLRQLL
jgi:Mrp family chromosome partitioning ATPase